MSEVNPSTLVKTVTYHVQKAQVIPSKVDPTLKTPGVPADAKVTGDRINAALDGLEVNGKKVQNKKLTLYGTEIPLSDDEGAQTVEEAVRNANSRTAADIVYKQEGLVSVETALDGIKEDMGADLTEADIQDILSAAFGGEA